MFEKIYTNSIIEKPKLTLLILTVLFLNKKISIKHSATDTLKIFNMIYKQVSDFNETSPIAYIVKKLSSTGLVSGLQIHKLMSMFVIDHEKASELLVHIMIFIFMSVILIRFSRLKMCIYF